MTVTSSRIDVSAGVLVARGQIALVVGLVVCTVLMPDFLFNRNMGGVSNYGTHALTVVPYTVGTLSGGWCMWRAGRMLSVSGGRPVVWVAQAASLALVVNLATTYTYRRGPTQGQVHTWTTIVLALVEFIGAFVLLRGEGGPVGRVSARNAFRCSGLLLAVGFPALFATYLGHLHVLFVAEVAVAAAFGLVLCCAAGGVPSRARN